MAFFGQKMAKKSVFEAKMDKVKKTVPTAVISHKLYGEFHFMNGPALVTSDGDEFWFMHGMLHRSGGPAITFSGGIKMWYSHNKLEKVVYPDGHTMYFN